LYKRQEDNTQIKASVNATDSLSGLMVPIHRALFGWSLPVAWSQMYAHLLDHP